MNFKTFTDWLRKRAYGESSGTPMRLHEERFHGPHFIDVWDEPFDYDTLVANWEKIDSMDYSVHPACRVSYLPSDEALAARDEEDRRNLRVGCKCPQECERPGHGS